MNPEINPEIFEDMDFPQDKVSILKYADENHADQTLLESVVKIPDRTYSNPREVMQAIKTTGHRPEDDDRVYLQDYIAVVGEEELATKADMSGPHEKWDERYD